jgi:hypothetical protein
MHYGKLLRNIAEVIQGLAKSLADVPQRLSGISEEISNNTGAIRQATEGQNENRQKPLPLPAVAEMQLPEADKREQRFQHQQNHALQIWLTVGTWLAFAAAAIYAGVAACQLGEMRKSTDASTKAADAATSDAKTAASEFALTKSRIEGQEQAIVQMTTADLDIRSGAAGITLSNSGQTTANNVHADFSIIRETFQDRKVIWKSDSYTLERSKLAKNDVVSQDYPVQASLSTIGQSILSHPSFGRKPLLSMALLNMRTGSGIRSSNHSAKHI